MGAVGSGEKCNFCSPQQFSDAFDRSSVTSSQNCACWRKPRWRATSPTISRKVCPMISSDGEGTRIERPYSALVVTALSNFTNATLSSLYFDITKDTLYANTLDSIERRSVVTVLEKVCVSCEADRRILTKRGRFWSLSRPSSPQLPPIWLRRSITMHMVGARTLQHADLYSRKNGNPWSVTLGYLSAVCS